MCSEVPHVNTVHPKASLHAEEIVSTQYKLLNRSQRTDIEEIYSTHACTYHTLTQQ